MNKIPEHKITWTDLELFGFIKLASQIPIGSEYRSKYVTIRRKSDIDFEILVNQVPRETKDELIGLLS